MHYWYFCQLYHEYFWHHRKNKEGNFSRFNKCIQYYIKYTRYHNIIPWQTDQNCRRIPGKKPCSLLQVPYFLEFSFIPFWITLTTFVASAFSKWKTCRIHVTHPLGCSVYQFAKQQGLPTFQTIHTTDLPWIRTLSYNSWRLTLPLC